MKNKKVILIIALVLVAIGGISFGIVRQQNAKAEQITQQKKKEAKKKERSTQVNIKRATVEANSKEELLDKIKNIEWDSIKPEDNKIGSRFDFSI